MGASILLADDERGMRDMLQWELGNLGHDIKLAATGTEAIAQLRAADFDVVISDIRMPGASGIEVLRTTRLLAPDTEVIMATGYADLQAADECLRGGGFDFLQ